MNEINWFDIATLSLILLTGIKGVFNGLIKETAGLIGIITGVFFASHYAEPFGKWIGKNFTTIDSATVLNLIGFLTLLTLIWLSFILAGIIIAKLISLSGMGFLDKFFGFIFASGKVFVVISIIVYALSNIEIIKKATEKYIATSFMHPFYYRAGKFIINIDLEKVKDRVNAIEEKSKKSIKNSTEIIHLQKRGNDE